MIFPIIFGREHKPLAQDEDSDKVKKHLSENPSVIEKMEVLGLYLSNRGICPGDYIGAVWVGSDDNRVALCVNSKFEDPTMDYMRMFAACCADSYVGERMQDCFEVWPEQELIEVPNAASFSFMVVTAFLRELNTLCVRHLRQHFERRRENLVGRVKGKIIIGENLRRNVGHAERVFSEYQSISNDILENRILRAALEKAARYLSTYQTQVGNYPVLQRWVYACRSHLQGVSVVNIARNDFGAVRQRGAFAPYRRPLHLAKAVLHHFGFNPLEEWIEIVKTPPYAIDSAELFERYAELQLRRKFRNNIVASYKKHNIHGPNRGFNVTVRPDFYVPQQEEKRPRVIDAKYKNLGNKTPLNDDLYQMLAYSRHVGILRKLADKHSSQESRVDDVVLHLAYPWLNGMPVRTKPDFTEAFGTPIRLCKIECPTISSNSATPNTPEE